VPCSGSYYHHWRWSSRFSLVKEEEILPLATRTGGGYFFLIPPISIFGANTKPRILERRINMAKKNAHTRNTTRNTPSGSTNPHGDKEWWETFFDEHWGRLGFDSIKEEQTERETAFLVEALGLEKTDKVLDLACGVGRHSLELARRGFKHVVGLDFTQAYLKEAIVRARHEKLSVEFVRGDMKDLPFAEDEFDAVFNFYTSFGYFADEKDNERVIAEVARVLKPGGRFLLDTVHRDYIVRNFAKRGWSEYNGEYILEERSFDLAASRNDCTWIYVTRKGNVEKKLSLRMYSLHELVAMFERAGLEYKEAWGNFDFEPLTYDHYRQKLLASKK
jgi:ubiquinone/menaquinone biosynthesis C-methylase UbiE